MVDKTIAALTAASTLTGAELIYGTQGGADRKLTAAQIAALVNTTPAGDTIIIQTNTTDFKDSVAVATTANITLSGEQTIDGVLTSASRVLVKNQTTGSQNGIYVSAAGAWSRATDADADSEVTAGLLVLVEGGTVGANLIYILTTANPITVGTTALTFTATTVPVSPSIPTNWQQTTKTLVISDPNKWFLASNASTQTLTAPPNASVKIGVGAELWVQKIGAGNVVVAPGAGVTIRSPQGLTIWTQYAYGKLKKIAVNEWLFTIYDQGEGFIPQNSKSAAYTTVIGDAGGHIYHPGADTTARIWTIDSNANVPYPIGTALTFVNDTLGGVITIAITSDTMVLAGAGTTGSRTLAASGVATAIKMTSTRWMISGTGLT